MTKKLAYLAVSIQKKSSEILNVKKYFQKTSLIFKNEKILTTFFQTVFRLQNPFSLMNYTCKTSIDFKINIKQITNFLVCMFNIFLLVLITLHAGLLVSVVNCDDMYRW